MGSYKDPFDFRILQLLVILLIFVIIVHEVMLPNVLEYSFMQHEDIP